MKNKYILDVFDEKEVKSLGADLSEGNDYITETAGFIPLEVKLKQFEQNGYIAQFQEKDFTSHDYRELYLNPDFDITPEDDFEDAMEKLEALKKYQAEYKANMAKSDSTKDKAGTDEPEKSEKTEETADAE